MPKRDCVLLPVLFSGLAGSGRNESGIASAGGTNTNSNP